MQTGKRVPRGDRWREPAKQGNAFGRFCRRHAFRPGTLLTLLLALILLAGGIWWFAGSRLAVSSAVTKLGLRNIGEMATQAGYFTSVQTIRKSRDVFGIEVPGTQSNYVYSYDGDIKAGLDFEDVEVNVNELTRVITVRLPEIRILSVEIREDSFKLYNDGNNLFTSLKMEDVNESLAELKKTARETAVQNGILENARKNAETLIRGFLASTADLNVYTVRFEPELSEEQP